MSLDRTSFEAEVKLHFNHGRPKCRRDGFMDKKTLVEMINEITDQDTIEYLFVIVFNAYRESCSEQAQ